MAQVLLLQEILYISNEVKKENMRRIKRSILFGTTKADIENEKLQEAYPKIERPKLLPDLLNLEVLFLPGKQKKPLTYEEN